MRQSETTIEKLKENKFAVKDKNGKVFKYMTYGNAHHVEIYQHKQKGHFKGQFISMMQASHRAKGIQSELNPEGSKQSVIQTKLADDNWQFIMALCKNDLVSAFDDSNERNYYRVQIIDAQNNKLILRHHLAATIKNKQQELTIRITADSFGRRELKLHKINVIGMLSDD